MANAPKISNAAAKAAADALCALLNTGYLRIYGGTKAADADTSTAETLLAELRFGATAFAGAVNNVATANTITPDSDADATGTATWFRALGSNGTSVVFDGTAGATSGFDLNLNSADIQIHAAVSVTSFVYTQNKG